MRPLELSLEGFTSFRRLQHLDFSELDLFAITGATGAGKSSILDAMTYALYGTTTRTGKQTGDLLSQGATQLKVQFRFLVGTEQYRITRRWRYRSSSPENKIILESLQKGEWETIGTSLVATQKNIEEILGMDFDTFTRVIILPQGKFDEFLKGDKSKRREILRSLAGFEIFEQMRKEAGELAKMLKQEREMIERQLAELNTPTAEEVAEKQAQLTELEQQLPTLNEAVIKAERTLQDAETRFKQMTRFRQIQTELETLSAEASQIAGLQVQVEQVKSATILQKDWVIIQDVRQNLSRNEEAEKEAKEALKIAQETFKTKQKQLEQVRTEVEAKTQEIQKQEESLTAAKLYEEQRLQLVTEVTKAQESLQQKAAQQNTAKKSLKDALDKVQIANNRLTETTATLSQNSPGGIRLEQLHQISPLLVELKLVSQQLATEQKQLEKVGKTLKKAEKTYQDLQQTLQAAEETVQQAQQALNQAETANIEAAKVNQAAMIRTTLKPGDLCPVCGGIHPAPAALPLLPALEVIDLAPLQSQYLVAQQAFQEAQIAHSKAETTLDELNRQHTEIAQLFQQTQAKYNTIQSQISEIIETSNWEVQFLEEERETLQLNDRNYREAEQQLQKATAELETAQQALQFAQQTHDTAQTEWQTACSELERRQQQLQIIETKLFGLTNHQSYEFLARNLQQEKQEISSRLKSAENDYQVISNQVIQLEERDKQATLMLHQAQTRYQEISGQWITQLEGADFTEAMFLEAAKNINQQATWEATIRQHQDTKIQLETRLQDLAEQLGTMAITAATIAELTEQIDHFKTVKKTAETTVETVAHQRTNLSTWLQISRQQLEQSEQLLSQKITLTEHEQTYHTLAQNLKSNEFQAYILEHLELELVRRATLILQELTENRYALTIQEGDYWVEDNWNGGELRRVRTLSGGETFATSLSMALALSEKLSQGAKLGSLFLDEGFGTLDAETLESVTLILESLRQQSRLIGVISHVRGLGERLPAQIKVFKSPQGSRIEVEMQ
jgi:exonuclease SbcC